MKELTVGQRRQGRPLRPRAFLFVGFLTALILSGRPVVFPQEARHSIGIVVAESELEVREEPSMAAKTLLTLPPGTQVRVLGQKSEVVRISGVTARWTSVQYEGATGWVLQARHHLALTKPCDEKLFVARFKGLDIRKTPLPSGSLVAHVPYGAEVRILTHGFQSDAFAFWVYVEFGGYRGYMRAGPLTNVPYAASGLAMGPFEGLVYVGLPEEFEWGAGAPLDLRYGIPESADKDNYHVIGLAHKNRHFTILQACIGRIAGFDEYRIIQVIDHSLYPGLLSQFDSGLNAALDGISCHLPGLTFFAPAPDGRELPMFLPMALLDMKKSKGVRQPDGSVLHRNVIRKAWVFDVQTERLKEVPPAGGWCVFYPFSG